MSLIDRVVLHPLGDDPPQARLLYGQDVRASLRLLEAESVQVVCTSPPYWGLRDYGGEPSVWGGSEACEHEWGQEEGYQGHRGNRGQVPQTKWQSNETYPQQADATAAPQSWCELCGAWLGQFGLEPTPALYVEHMVEVFEEIRRVLRPDGIAWLNLGDSYNGVGGHNWGGHPGVREARSKGERGSSTEGRKDGIQGNRRVTGLKPKDLVGIPWRVAFGLQDDGWWLRSDIVWAKANCMPESVRDRPTRAHEYIFLLTKSDHYFYDQDAIREPFSASSMQNPLLGDDEANKALRTRNRGGRTDGFTTAPGAMLGDALKGRNKRTVWTINPKPYQGAHFATWPEALVEPMVLAGSSAHGCCSECRAPYVRRVERTVPVDAGRSDDSQYMQGKDSIIGRAHDAHRLLGQAYQNQLDANPLKTTGWDATCECEADVVPCTVLDPFSGSATTGAVALRLGRNYIGCDLQGDYLDLAEARLQGRKAPSKGEPESDLISDLFG